MKATFDVIYQDNHLIIVNKPAGMLVQGDKTGDSTLLDHVKQYIKEKFNKPGNVFLGLVHRIDRPVSGLVILAKTSKALERMTEMFRNKKISKTYWAITHTPPKDKGAKLVHWLVKDEQINKTTAHAFEHPEGKRSELTYKLKGKVNDHFLLEVHPLTGRPHQIRAQLAAISCPIRGDIKYGAPRPNRNGSINLHARRVDFLHPVTKEPVVCIAPLPPDPFWEEFLVLDDLRKTSDKNLKYIN